jgi:hypothetical protein
VAKCLLQGVTTKFQHVVAIGGIFLFALTRPALSDLLESEFAADTSRESVSLSAPEYDYDLPYIHFEISTETEPSTTVEVAASGQQVNVAASSVHSSGSLNWASSSAGVSFEMLKHT